MTERRSLADVVEDEANEDEERDTARARRTTDPFSTDATTKGVSAGRKRDGERVGSTERWREQGERRLRSPTSLGVPL